MAFLLYLLVNNNSVWYTEDTLKNYRFPPSLLPSTHTWISPHELASHREQTGSHICKGKSVVTFWEWGAGQWWEGRNWNTEPSLNLNRKVPIWLVSVFGQPSVWEYSRVSPGTSPFPNGVPLEDLLFLLTQTLVFLLSSIWHELQSGREHPRHLLCSFHQGISSLGLILSSPLHGHRPLVRVKASWPWVTASEVHLEELDKAGVPSADAAQRGHVTVTSWCQIAPRVSDRILRKTRNAVFSLLVKKYWFGVLEAISIRILVLLGYSQTHFLDVYTFVKLSGKLKATDPTRFLWVKVHLALDGVT